MDSSPRDTLDRLATSNRSHGNNIELLRPYSFLPASLRRASSDTRLEVLQHQDVVRKLQRKYEAEVDPLKKQRHVAQSEDGFNEDNLELEFEACIQEHQDTKMKISPKLFRCLKHSHFYIQLLVYYISVLVIGVPATLLWGCLSGATVFARVWIWVPVLKLILFWLYSCAPVLLRPAHVLCIPCVDICARRYRQIRIHTKLNGVKDIPVVVRNV